MNILGREKIVRTLLGTVFTCLFAALVYFSPNPFKEILGFLENGSYDLQLRQSFKPAPKESPIIIIDIDDRSIKAEGRWPWPREKTGRLVEILFEQGVSVAAFDILFSEKQRNLAEAVANDLKNSPELKSELLRKAPEFDYDQAFADSLKKGESVLGYVMKESGNSVNSLPPPFLILTSSELSSITVPDMPAFIGNIPVLQEAAKSGGFMNASPDSDGILRYSPLVFLHEGALYPCLALAAIGRYLHLEAGKLDFGLYGDVEVLEGVRLGQRLIPTDAKGRVLIPFRGPSYSFPYYSATDILNGKFDPKMLRGRLAFIGSSASQIGDIASTSMSPSYNGVEVHACIASGILEGYLPYKPTWSQGVTVFLVLAMGLLSSIIQPQVGVLIGTIVAFASSALLFFASKKLWVEDGFVLPMIFPIFAIGVIYVADLVASYFSESKRRKELREIFGQYVPSEYIDSMFKEGGDFGIHGKTKELTVLFTDIRNFTKISEKMSASEVSDFLNVYLTPMTQIIFECGGTVDKYVGDLIMAFWGAPLDNPNNAKDGVLAALKMQQKLKELNVSLQDAHKPAIRTSIGINSGTMSVGDMGSKFRRAYTVIGDAVNLASRLEGVSKFYHVKIAVGQDTYEKTKDQFAYRKIDRIRVLGRETSVDVYEPLCTIEEKSGATDEILALHARTIESYFHQNWDEAEKGFRELHEKDSEERELYDVYLERISHFKQAPPPKEWDGTFTLDVKY